ncbi:MAG TPA: hypothetical protein VK793_07465, partial [Steroidobacteraceae bacterium]|nr:hypothetical protein [Steroidobacteraceae bacterium]
RRRVTHETTKQKASEALLFQLHLKLIYSSLDMTIGLQDSLQSGAIDTARAAGRRVAAAIRVAATRDFMRSPNG